MTTKAKNTKKVVKNFKKLVPKMHGGLLSKKCAKEFLEK